MLLWETWVTALTCQLRRDNYKRAVSAKEGRSFLPIYCVKLKTVISAFLAAITACYIAGFIGDPFIFIIVFNIALWTLCIVLAVIFFSFAIPFIRKLPHKKILLVCLATICIFTIIIVIKKNRSLPEASPVERFKSLSYLSYVPDDKAVKKEGVTIYDRKLAYQGINIYNSQDHFGAYLMDMSGRVLHKWLPDKGPNRWQYVEMYGKEGDLLVINKDNMLMRLDWDSNIVWKVKIRAHHDIAIDDEGNIYLLARKDDIIFIHGIPVPVLNDYIAILTPDGKVKREIFFARMLKEGVSFKSIRSRYRHMILGPRSLKLKIKQKRSRAQVFDEDKDMDIFHANAIEIINKDIDEIFRKGNVIYCARNINQVGVIDIEKEKVLWSWGKNYLSHPHYPTLLEDGNLLIFDNGYRRDYSRIVELDPHPKRIVWEYKADPPKFFKTDTGGVNQRLPNGNTFVTDSEAGRVFEITKNGKIVWEFYNTEYDKNGNRRTIYRMMRITDPTAYPKLEKYLRKNMGS